MATKNKPVERYKLLAECKPSLIHLAVAGCYAGFRPAPTMYAVKNKHGTRLVIGADVS